MVLISGRAAVRFGLCFMLLFTVVAGLAQGQRADAQTSHSEPVTLPGRIEAEDYNAGGQNVGYFDTSRGNVRGVYRSDDVDIEPTTDTGGGFNVGWIATGEWLEYDVTVESTGSYNFTFRVATVHSARTFHLEIDEVDVTGPLSVPRTGRWQSWTNVTSGPIELGGDHTLRIVMDSGDFNLNYVDVAAADESEVPPPPAEEHVLVGASDIAHCSIGADAITADLLDDIPGTVFTAGDNSQGDGSAAEFEECYDPNWGRHKDRTRPALGNHEYHTGDADAYFDYFGDAAGDPDTGYYTYALGAWQIIVLNSNCDKIVGDGCDYDSPQMEWLQEVLAQSSKDCTLAYWHHSRFSSGKHGNNETMIPFWEALYAAGAEVVISGHDHHYERFAPQDPYGNRDDENGIRAFVSGTGGGGQYGIRDEKPNSEVTGEWTYGVLKLTLRDAGYDWRFIPEPGHSFTDSGSGSCH